MRGGGRGPATHLIQRPRSRRAVSCGTRARTTAVADHPNLPIAHGRKQPRWLHPQCLAGASYEQTPSVVPAVPPSTDGQSVSLMHVSSAVWQKYGPGAPQLSSEGEQ